MNLLDLLIIAFLALNIFLGWKRGLLSQILGLAGVLIAFFVASRLGKGFGSWLAGFINFEKFAAKLVAVEAESKGLSGMLAGKLNEIVPDMAAAIQNILGYALLFLLALAAVKLLALAFKSLNRVPVLGKLNSLGGLVFGFIKSALLTMIILWALSLLPIPKVLDFVESSFLAPVLLDIAPGVYGRIFNPQEYEGVIKTIDKLQNILKPN